MKDSMKKDPKSVKKAPKGKKMGYAKGGMAKKGCK